MLQLILMLLVILVCSDLFMGELFASVLTGFLTYWSLLMDSKSLQSLEVT